MIVIQEDSLIELARSVAPGSQIEFYLGKVDDGDVLSEFRRTNSPARCLLVFDESLDTHSFFAIEDLEAVVFLRPLKSSSVGGVGSSVTLRSYLSLGSQQFEVSALRRRNQAIEEDEITLVPVQRDLFSRIKGLFETNALADKKVLIVGVGSGGSPIALELAKSGVQNFVLVDPDRLEVGNVARHIAGLPDLGRFKTRAVRDLILEKNPFAKVVSIEVGAEWSRQELLRELIGETDLVICGTDNRESKMLVNRISVGQGKVCLYGGAFRRAYGGQILRVRPRESVCYQCFLGILPDVAADQEISNQRQASEIQYSPDDPRVAIEPGLSIDIAPISQMMAKLAMLELLRGKETTFTTLYEDLIASWYLWVNRREGGTDYEHLKPLAYEIGEMSIMRWYGIRLERNPNCSVCGEFLQQIGAELRPEDVDFFKAS